MGTTSSMIDQIPVADSTENCKGFLDVNLRRGEENSAELEDKSL